MANGAPNASGIPRLINPTSYLLSQVAEGVDTYTKNRWEKHMNELLSGAVSKFYEGDDSALQQVLDLAGQTGMTQQIMPLVRDKLQTRLVERRELAAEDRRRGIGEDVIRAIGLPGGVSDEFAGQFLEMYAVDPRGAIDALGMMTRQQTALATANRFDIDEDPDYRMVESGMIKQDAMIRYMEGIPVDPTTGQASGRSSYSLQPEDYRFELPNSQQVPTSQLRDPATYYSALARGEDPTPYMQFTEKSPISDQWVIENTDLATASAYLDENSPRFRDPLLLVEGYTGPLDAAKLWDMKQDALIRFGESYDRLATTKSDAAYSVLMPQTPGGDELKRLMGRLNIDSPSLWNTIFKFIGNPGDPTYWTQAPQAILDAIDDLGTQEEKDSIRSEFQFSLGKIRELKRWGVERFAWQQTKMRELNQLMRDKGLDLRPGGPRREETSGANISSRSEESIGNPSVIEEEAALPPGWLLNNSPAYYTQNFTRETMAIQELEPITATDTEIRENGGEIPEGKISVDEAKEILDHLFPIR